MPAYYTSRKIAEVLQINAPILMLDQAEVSDDGLSANGIRLISYNEAVFAGHFPGQPILPGVLQVAAMTQLAYLIYLRAIPVMGGTRIVLKELRRIKFRKPVLPGDRMNVEARISERMADGTVLFQVSCHTDSGMASSGTLALGRVNPAEYDPLRIFRKNSTGGFAQEMAALPETTTAGLLEILPHRPPFMLIDRGYGLGSAEPDAYGYKNISVGDLLISGSGENIFPPYLMIEAGAQLGCAHVLSQPGNAGKLGIFMSIDEAHFYHHVFPGDRLAIHAKYESTGRAGSAAGEFMVDDLLVADCKLKFIIMDKIG